MGPYCKFCGNRCFKPTESGLIAQCSKGKYLEALVIKLKELEQNNKFDLLKDFHIKKYKEEITRIKTEYLGARYFV
jgi:hypothetical protein